MSEIKLELARGCYLIDSDNEELASAIPSSGCNKLNEYDWLSDIDTLSKSDIFEIRFKNTRKGYYQNVNDLNLKVGDIVAVEAAPGHDIGIISACGDMVGKQMKRTGFRTNGLEFKKIYRRAKPNDIAKWQRAISLEHKTMILSRQIASSLELNMKIGDVEYQGDGAKAIFYYIADERVDFRELIKIFAEQFRIRIEMKQIGARQEAGRIGGLGSCGRELCCSKWVSNFVSVTTSSARFQEISLNPQKLAGQCGKLKCCLNYEVDAYIDYKKRLPKVFQPLETFDGQYHLVKTDILRGLMSFSSDPYSMINIITIGSDRVREIIKLNKRGVKVDKLVYETTEPKAVEPSFKNVVGEESITRFDASRQSSKPRNKGNNNKQRKEDNTQNTQPEEVVTLQENRPKQQRQRPNKNNRPKPQQSEDKQPVEVKQQTEAKQGAEVKQEEGAQTKPRNKNNYRRRSNNNNNNNKQ